MPKQHSRPRKKEKAWFTCRLLKSKLRIIRRREGSYLLHTTLREIDPVNLWKFYLQLTQVEEAFKNLKNDLGI